MKLTMNRSTGHFAMSQTWTPVSPTPISLPASSARPPVRVTASAVTAAKSDADNVFIVLTARSLRDMKWLDNARSAALKKLQRENGTWAHEKIGATALAGLTLLVLVLAAGALLAARGGV